MTHDKYKTALDEWKSMPFSISNSQAARWTEKHQSTIQAALQLAQEVEQMREKMASINNPVVVDNDLLEDLRQAVVADDKEKQQLRKERDELAKAVVYLNAICGSCAEVKYLSKTINLAKKVNENGNA